MLDIQEDTTQSIAPSSAAVFRTVNGNVVIDGNRYDFAAVQDVTDMRTTKERVLNPRINIKTDSRYIDRNNQPDRFIQFIGKDEAGKRVRKLGFVLGFYSGFGICRPEERAKNTKSFSLANWCKTYPNAFSRDRGECYLAAGTVLKAQGYRQYFDPQRYPNATSVYWHDQDGATMVYIDYHKSVDGDIIQLPNELVGQNVKIYEKLSGVELLSGPKLAKEGLRVKVTGNYGFLVLRITK